MVKFIAEGNRCKDSKDLLVVMASDLTSPVKTNKNKKRVRGHKCSCPYPRKHSEGVREKKQKLNALVKCAQHAHFEPHMGSTMSTIHDKVYELAKFAGIDCTDELVSHIEGLIALIVTIEGCKDYLAVSSAIFLYVRKFFSTSITKQVMQYVSDLFEVHPHSGDDTYAGDECEDIVKTKSWIDMLKGLRDDWKLVRESSLFDHFSKLLGLFVTLEMCEASRLTFSVKEYKVWEPDMKVVHGSAGDVFDAALCSVVFFVERMSLSWQMGTLKPFLIDDLKGAEVDEEYTTVTLWWDLLRNGNLKRVAKVSEKEFDKRLEALTSTMKELRNGFKGFERKMMNEKLAHLLRIKNDYITSKISCGVRKSPFCVELFGDSDQGKTTFGEQMISALLTSNGLPTDKQYQARYNPTDNFLSTWTTDKLVMLMDDVANENAQFASAPPTRAIIDIANNAPFYANKAELEAKGKVFVEPELLLVTTNVKDLDARVYSNCPYSVQRRMHVVVTVSVKDKFQRYEGGRPQGIDVDKVTQFSMENPDAEFDDIWELTCQRAIKPPHLELSAPYGTIKYKGVVLTKVNLRTAMNYLIDCYTAHVKAQEVMLGRVDKRKNLKLCGVDGCNQIRGWCDTHHWVKSQKDTDVSDNETDGLELKKEENKSLWQRITGYFSGSQPDTVSIPLSEIYKPNPDFDGCDDELVDDFDVACIVEQEVEYITPHFGDEIANSLAEGGRIVRDRVMGDLYGVDAAWGGMASSMILVSAKTFARRWDWMKFVPTPWLDNPHFEKFLCFVNADRLRKNYLRRSLMLWGSIGAWTWYGSRGQKWPYKCVLGSVMTMTGLICQKTMVHTVKKHMLTDLRSRNVVAPALKEWRDKHVGTICKASAIVGALYTLAKVYKAWRRTIEPQGTLEPKTASDIITRDSEENVWTSVIQRPLPVGPLAANTTSDQLCGLVEKNLVYGSVQIGSKTLMVNGLFLTSNVVLIPHHYFEAPTIDVTFRKCNPDACGGKFAVRLSLAQSVLLPNSDMRVCYSSSGGSFKDLRKYLPDGIVPSAEFKMLWRAKDGNLTRADGLAELCDTSNGVADFEGLVYKSLTINTFRGMCGAVLVAKARPLLLGIHLGGRAGTPQGCAGFFRAAEIQQAILDLKKLEGVIVSGSAEKFEAQVLGVKILTNGPLHKKSPLNYMPKDSQIEYYGTCPGASTFSTNVKVTPISDIVTDVTGVPNVYCGPVVEPQWYGWQTCLENLANPALPFEPELLTIAIRDYKEDLLPLFTSPLWKDVRPLSDSDNLCGVPGKKFLDAINLSTSIGFPLSGQKRKYVLELEPMEGKPNNRVFDSIILDEVARYMDCYRNGHRAYAIAKACKKDEILSKKKCRIFYANGIALTFLVRRYFLPLLRVFQFNPKTSECAVGVNAHGPEWDELHDHIFTFGNDRLIGGDYGKYDQKLPSQLLFAALRILIDCARAAGYDERDLEVMEAMTGDIVYALVAYNGDLIGFTEGTHISGNSLTVILNGICGSLNLRCYFYSENPPLSFARRLPFRTYVKLITYGDDNIGSVSHRIDNFTIAGASAFLARYGQTYTMPDKESKLLDFLPPEEFEFLKRKSVYHPLLGVHVGALCEKSCFKMLHCFLREKNHPLTEEHACALNIDTALREWFNHGRDIYEKRRVQMKQIAKMANITHLCLALNYSYEECAGMWREKYLKEEYVLYDSDFDFFPDL